MGMPQKLALAPMGTSRKVKAQISPFVLEQVLMDVEDYGLRSPSALYVHLCAQGADCLPATMPRMREEAGLDLETISFTLPPAVAAPFVEACLHRQVGTAAATRFLLQRYVSLPRCLREESVRGDEVRWLKLAIRRGRCVSLEYRGEPMMLEPSFLAHSQGMARAYLVAYDSVRDDFRCLRLAHIRCVELGSVESTYKKEASLTEKAKKLRKHFDPFLSHEQTVTVRLSAAGAQHMMRATTNRPSCPEILQAGVYEFQCSPLQAQLYFAAFLDEAEILAPLPLREWFAAKLRRAAGLYNALT